MSGVPRCPTIRRDCRCVHVQHQHGTALAYRRDLCRCDLCRRSIAAEQSYRRRMISYGRWGQSLLPAIGTARRLRALAASGWSVNQVAARSGLHVSFLRRLVREDGLKVLPRTAAAVASVYDELWNQPPQGTPNSVSKTRMWAQRQGWFPPLAWDDDSIDDPAAEPYRSRYVSAADRGIDEIAVAEAIHGRHVHLTPDERAEAVRRMTERGYSSAEIAERLGATQRSVVRTRSARGIRGAA